MEIGAPIEAPPAVSTGLLAPFHTPSCPKTVEERKIPMHATAFLRLILSFISNLHRDSPNPKIFEPFKITVFTSSFDFHN